MDIRSFAMERWQSTYENRVAYNLSESGVHPLTLAELLELAGETMDSAGATSLSYGQSNGTDELRAAIAALYPGATAENVLVTNGSAEANFAAVWELIGAGDEAVVLLPTYMQTPALVEGFGGRVRAVHLREETGWQPDRESIDRAITDRTRLIIVTNPNNPTGATLSAEARDRLLAAAERAGAWILADEVYAGAELHGPPTPSLWGDYPRVIATGSLSKAYGLPGLRIGWAVTRPDMADRLWARTDYTTISTGLLADRLATLALRSDTRLKLLERTRTILRERLATLTEWLDASGWFVYHPPAAGAICYARYTLDINSSELAERLRTEQDVLIVPGDHFGMDGYLRIGYGIEAPALRTALDRTRHTLGTIA